MSIDYGHGDDLHRYKETVFKGNFSSNVWYKGAPESLIRFLKEKISTIESYPAPNAEEVSFLIEKHHHIKPQSVIVTNGATEAFYLVANTFHGCSVTICNPSFSEYELASKVNKLAIHFTDRKSVLTHQFKTDIAFICNPNNPDGFENTPEEIETLIQQYPNTLFIIDEAYVEFTSSSISCIELTKTYKNILLIKSLTKLFCIPGLRLGYIIGHSSFINKIGSHKMPWNVNSMALHAASFIFKNYNNIYPDFDDCFKTTSSLKKAIQKIKGFDVINTNTTYFLIKLQKPLAKELKEYLVTKHQLLIRNASNFNTLNNHYIRVASQSPQKNQLLINALQQWNQ